MLVEAAQAGCRKSFDMLVLKYQRRLMRLISRLVFDPAQAEDLTQDSFINAYRALKHFRGDSAFYTWLYRIGLNTAKNFLVSQARRGAIIVLTDAEESEGFVDASSLRNIDTPESMLESKQLTQAINDAVDALPDDVRISIVLRELDGLSYEEIAHVMKCPVGTVRSRIFRARETIAEKIRPMLDRSKGDDRF
ncbi:RNA polymerase sigma factor RpoE [Massilia sp. P8910]|uniref:RNA polymerase sigma factor RpoE n=1 Tax=Massilia antarctica TaxID=2765360 RepID=UPI001E5A0587|nr:RNA polymerase sigma factor RpoE [Massilia antarctica]MCE3602747.1 RNA polymerase sigma factor RpoE [Massilia antarctica]